MRTPLPLTNARPDEEKLLIERARAGDTDAFEALMHRYERQVYNLAYRMTGNQDDAGDVAAEAFVRVFNAMKRFRGESAFSTWLYRIVTNVFLDERKRRLNHPVVSLDDSFEIDGVPVARQYEDDSPSPTALAEAAEQRRVLDRAIRNLPEFQSQIVTMYHMLNLSYEEIAEILQLPVGTVKSRLNRARLALRDALSEHAELFGLPS